MSALIESLRLIILRRELLALLIVRDVRQRYLRTWLGVLWILLQPLLLLVFYAFVFSVVFRVRVPGVTGDEGPAGYMLFVVGGLLPWLAFADGTIRAAQSLIGHASVITKVAFPVELLPLSAVAASFVSLVVSTGFVAVVLLTLGKLSWPILSVPLLMLILAATALGFGYLLSVLNAFVRDISQVLGFAFNLWLYATPVLYPAEAVPESFRFLLNINPMLPIISSFRQALVLGEWPEPRALLLATAIAALMLLLGLSSFIRAKRLYAELL